MIPIAKPRPSRNQPATIFIPGGYTPARAAPVTRRSAIPTTRVGAIATPSVASPATTADAWTSRRADQMSLSVSIADTSAPTTKPSCTEMVSQAAPAGPSCHRRESVGATAEALNHGAMARGPRGRAPPAPAARSQAGGMVEERPGQAELRAQVLRQRLDAERLSRVVPGVEHVQSQLLGVEEGVVRAFAGDVGVESRRLGLGDQRARSPGDDAHPPHLLGPERHDSRRRAQHGGELLLQSAA